MDKSQLKTTNLAPELKEKKLRELREVILKALKVIFIELTILSKRLLSVTSVVGIGLQKETVTKLLQVRKVDTKNKYI